MQRVPTTAVLPSSRESAPTSDRFLDGPLLLLGGLAWALVGLWWLGPQDLLDVDHTAWMWMSLSVVTAIGLATGVATSWIAQRAPSAATYAPAGALVAWSLTVAAGTWAG